MASAITPGGNQLASLSLGDIGRPVPAGERHCRARLIDLHLVFVHVQPHDSACANCRPMARLAIDDQRIDVSSCFNRAAIASPACPPPTTMTVGSAVGIVRRRALAADRSQFFGPRKSREIGVFRRGPDYIRAAPPKPLQFVERGEQRPGLELWLLSSVFREGRRKISLPRPFFGFELEDRFQWQFRAGAAITRRGGARSGGSMAKGRGGEHARRVSGQFPFRIAGAPLRVLDVPAQRKHVPLPISSRRRNSPLPGAPPSPPARAVSNCASQFFPRASSPASLVLSSNGGVSRHRPVFRGACSAKKPIPSGIATESPITQPVGGHAAPAAAVCGPPTCRHRPVSPRSDTVSGGQAGIAEQKRHCSGSLYCRLVLTSRVGFGLRRRSWRRHDRSRCCGAGFGLSRQANGLLGKRPSRVRRGPVPMPLLFAASDPSGKEFREHLDQHRESAPEARRRSHRPRKPARAAPLELTRG